MTQIGQESPSLLHVSTEGNNLGLSSFFCPLQLSTDSRFFNLLFFFLLEYCSHPHDWLKQAYQKPIKSQPAKDGMDGMQAFFFLSMPGLSCSIQDLVSWTRIKSGPLVLRVWSLTHWTTREAPGMQVFSFPMMWLEAVHFTSADIPLVITSPHAHIVSREVGKWSLDLDGMYSTKAWEVPLLRRIRRKQMPGVISTHCHIGWLPSLLI